MRFWAKVDKSHGEDGCWEWAGARTGHDGKGAYGVIWQDGRQVGAHRVSYEMHHGPIPQGAVVMHACDNPPCVNPKHLSAGSLSDNNLDAFRKGRNHVARGEECNLARLTAADVEAIRSEYAEGGVTQRVLAAKYGTDFSNVSKILRGETWQ